MIPELRFPEFEGNWNPDKLGSVADFSKGKGISKADISEDGITECIRYGELYTEYSEVITEIVSKTNIDESELVLSDANDVIIPASGETQIDIATASCVAKTGVALGGDLNIIKSAINGIFLSYYLNNAQKTNIARLSQGISVVHLYASQLKTLNIYIPEPEEQNKIATFLTAVDKRIKLLQKKKAEFEQYKKGVMQKLFSQTIRFKDESGNDFPEWEEMKLGEICNYHNGGSFEKVIVEHGPYNLITLNSIDINGKLKSTHKKVNVTDNSLNKDDLVMVLSDVAHGNFLGLTDIIPDDSYVLNQRMGALKPKITINLYFLKTYINFHQKYFKLMGQGSSQQNLSKGDILKFLVRTPHINEQSKIAKFLISIDNSIDKLGSQIDDSTKFKQGLLQKMFV
ncbi:MAG: restriction endonuclease subunit S [Candidatus Neomarinimicrobiota bacterium]